MESFGKGRRDHAEPQTKRNVPNRRMYRVDPLFEASDRPACLSVSSLFPWADKGALCSRKPLLPAQRSYGKPAREEKNERGATIVVAETSEGIQCNSMALREEHFWNLR